MTDITISRDRDVCDRGTRGQYPIVACLALRRQGLKHTPRVAGLAIQQIMIASKGKTSNQVVKGRRVYN